MKKDEDGQFRVIDQDYSKLLETVKVESVRRDIPKALISAIEYLEKLNSEDKSVYFDLVSNKSRLQSVLYSIANKRVIRQKFKGDNYVQQSSLGFEVRQDPEAFGLKELASYREGISAFMEVYLPHYFKEFGDRELTVATIPIYNKSKRRVIGTKEVIKDLNTGEILGDSSLLEAIGIRIPTDGIHSIEAIRIKGFLPRAAGPTIIVPSELVTKSGSDFDIDKLSVYLPSYTVRGNRLVKERFYEDTKEWYTAEQARLKRNMDTLEDLEDVMDSTGERRDAIINILTDSFISKMFGEELADDIFEEYKIPLNEEKFDKLAQYLNSNSEDAVKFYEKIKNNIETSQVLEKSFEEWQTDNPEASVYNLNRRGAMQNQYMDDMRTLVTDPSRRMEYMKPVGVEKIAATKALIQELYEKQGNDTLIDLAEVDDYYDATTITNLIRVYEAFFKGKKVVGPSALNTTHHSKSQKAGLMFDMLNKSFKLPYRIGQTVLNKAGKEKLMPFKINFEGFQGQSTLSLSGILDSDGGRISDNLSQVTNASVDIVKNPDLHFLNLDPNNANMWMFLIRLGVPIQTIALFANQPIVKDYMEALEVDKSKTSEVMKQSKEFRADVVKGIREKYMAPGQYNMVYSTEILAGTVAVDVEAMSTEDKSLQLQILDDMLFYSGMGDNLGNIVAAQSFDTKTFNNQNEVRVALQMYQNALDTEAFINVEKITEGQDITVPEVAPEVRKYTPENITSLEPNQVFVFGANTAGGHGGGTAGLAQRGNTKSNYTALPQGTKGKWAEYGVVDQLMEGTEGKSFGIVTKAASVSGTKLKIGSRRSVPLERIEQSINSLIETANNNPELEFLVTKFGTNMAGFTIAEMKSLLEGKSLPDNIILPKEFETRLTQPTTEVTEGVYEEFVPSTFMESMTEFNVDLENLFNSLYLVNNAGTNYQKGFNRVLSTFINPKVFMDNQDRARVLNRYENGYISFLLQNLKGDNGVALGEEIGGIKFGDNSIAKTIAYIQDPVNKHPFRTNGFITSLNPVIASKKDGVALSDDYLEPINRSISTPEMNMLHDEFKKLKGIPGEGKNLADNIIKAAYLQSGLNPSKTSFLDTIPGDDIMELFKEVLDQFEDGYGSLEKASDFYYTEFFRQVPNSDDYTMVPKYTTSNIKTGTYDFTFKFTEASVVARNKAIEEGNIPPRLEKTLYLGENTISKHGSPTLEDYYRGSGPRTTSNIDTEKSSESDKNIPPSDSVLPDENC